MGRSVLRRGRDPGWREVGVLAGRGLGGLGPQKGQPRVRPALALASYGGRPARHRLGSSRRKCIKGQGHGAGRFRSWGVAASRRTPTWPRSLSLSLLP